MIVDRFHLVKKANDMPDSVRRRGPPAPLGPAYIGCRLHTEAGASKPMAHWIELLDRRLAA